MKWYDKTRIEALMQYVRMAVGIILIGLFIYAFVTERIDIDQLMRAILGALALDRMVIGAQAVISNRN